MRVGRGSGWGGFGGWGVEKEGQWLVGWWDWVVVAV